jgi:hypothetical protein
VNTRAGTVTGDNATQWAVAGAWVATGRPSLRLGVGPVLGELLGAEELGPARNRQNHTGNGYWVRRSATHWDEHWEKALGIRIGVALGPSRHSRSYLSGTQASLS